MEHLGRNSTPVQDGCLPRPRVRYNADRQSKAVNVLSAAGRLQVCIAASSLLESPTFPAVVVQTWMTGLEQVVDPQESFTTGRFPVAQLGSVQQLFAAFKQLRIES